MAIYYAAMTKHLWAAKKATSAYPIVSVRTEECPHGDRAEREQSLEHHQPAWSFPTRTTPTHNACPKPPRIEAFLDTHPHNIRRVSTSTRTQRRVRLKHRAAPKTATSDTRTRSGMH